MTDDRNPLDRLRSGRLAALIAREGLDIMPDRALGHYTHEKNPVACAAGLATIAVIDEEGLLAHTAELGAYALEKLRALQQRHPIIGDVRGIGLQLGVELLRDGKHATGEAEQVMYAALAILEACLAEMVNMDRMDGKNKMDVRG